MKVLVRAIKHNLSTETVGDLFPPSAQIGAILGHQSPHILQVLNVGIHQDRVPFYVLESSKNTTLKALMTATPMATTRLLSLMQQICLGLGSAHHGFLKDGARVCVAHGDLKPTNILVFADSGLGEIAKIMGFGLKDFVAGHHQSCFMGTPAYSAPEHFEGKTTPSSDIYSLGVMIFLGLTGHLPIQATAQTLKHWHHAHREVIPRKLQEVAPTLLLPQSLQDLLMVCLAKNPLDRPQDAMEVAKLLKDCLLELTPNPDLQISTQNRNKTKASPRSDFSQPTSQRVKQMAGSVS